MSEQSTVPVKSGPVIQRLPAAAAMERVPAAPEIARNAMQVYANYLRRTIMERFKRSAET